MRSSSIFKAQGLLPHESALGQPLSKIARAQKKVRSGQKFESSVSRCLPLPSCLRLPHAEGQQVVILPNKGHLNMAEGTCILLISLDRVNLAAEIDERSNLAGRRRGLMSVPHRSKLVEQIAPLHAQRERECPS